MKFLCEHCKAKYQIADEKAAGRTVRMKCRKCGHMIEVRAAVTETSVATSAPPTDPPAAGGRSLATSLSNAPKPAPARATSVRPAEGGSLSSAFQRDLAAKDEDIPVALDLRQLSATDEWYVAINGVPVGPIRVTELRRKAVSGIVGDDSLCWQEGMEEWRPVRAVAELAALVREAAASARTSVAAPSPPAAAAEPSRGSVPGPPRPTLSRPVTSGPMAPRAPRPAAAPLASLRSNVVPITSRLATAERFDDQPTRIEAAPEMDPPPPVVADPFASASPAPAPLASLGALLPSAPEPATGSLGSFPSPFSSAPAPPFSSGPAASPPVSSAPAPAIAAYASGQISALSSSPLPALIPSPALAASMVPERKPPNYIAIAMIALAMAFGVTAAVVLVKPTPQVVVQVPATPTATAAATAAAGTALPSIPAPPPTAAESAAAAEAPAPVAAGKTGAPWGGSHPSSSAGKPAAPAIATDPALRDLIAGAAAGPAAGPGESSGGGGGGQLTADQVQSVLQSHQVGLKRTCWDRMQTAASTVNESVHIVVSPGGQVTSASASGNEPTVGHCIEGEVRRWTFPGSGEINIPFHFLRQ